MISFQLRNEIPNVYHRFRSWFCRNVCWLQRAMLLRQLTLELPWHHSHSKHLVDCIFVSHQTTSNQFYSVSITWFIVHFHQISDQFVLLIYFRWSHFVKMNMECSAALISIHTVETQWVHRVDTSTTVLASKGASKDIGYYSFNVTNTIFVTSIAVQWHVRNIVNRSNDLRRVYLNLYESSDAAMHKREKDRAISYLLEKNHNLMGKAENFMDELQKHLTEVRFDNSFV